MTYIEERIYLPEGMPVDDLEAVWFAVRVQWRASGGLPRGGAEWAVVQGLGFPSSQFLSRTGRWIFCPRPMHRRYCRFDFETACRLAEEAVNKVQINGLTWAEWEARRAL